MSVSVLRGEQRAQLVFSLLVEVGVAVALLLAEIDGSGVSSAVPLGAVVASVEPRASHEQHGHHDADEQSFQRGHGVTSSGKVSRRCRRRPSMIETRVSA